MDDWFTPAIQARNADPDEEGPAFEIADQPYPTLMDALLSQLSPLGCSPDDYRLLSYLIENLDENGYLPLTRKELCDLTGRPAGQVERCL